MKKHLCVVLTFALMLFSLAISVFADEREYLAQAIAAAMGEEPFVVKVAYGELLLNRVDSEIFADKLPPVLYSMRTRTEGAHAGTETLREQADNEDYRAATVALRRYGFCGDALYIVDWEEAKSTPLSMRSGVRLYSWFFYR